MRKNERGEKTILLTHQIWPNQIEFAVVKQKEDRVRRNIFRYGWKKMLYIYVIYVIYIHIYKGVCVCACVCMCVCQRTCIVYAMIDRLVCVYV
jgi:hypothetical protein